jgi:hypothetical protein
MLFHAAIHLLDTGGQAGRHDLSAARNRYPGMEREGGRVRMVPVVYFFMLVVTM